MTPERVQGIRANGDFSCSLISRLVGSDRLRLVTEGVIRLAKIEQRLIDEFSLAELRQMGRQGLDGLAIHFLFSLAAKRELAPTEIDRRVLGQFKLLILGKYRLEMRSGFVEVL